MMTIEIDGETYLTFNEACNLLGVTRVTIDRYVERKLLKKYRQHALATRVYFKLTELQALRQIG